MANKYVLASEQRELLADLEQDIDLSPEKFTEKFTNPLCQHVRTTRNECISTEKPLDVLEFGISEIERLQKLIHHKIQKHTNASKAVQNEYTEKSQEMKNQFNKVDGIFHSLDSTVSGMKADLVGVGHELEHFENHRKRILTSSSLFQCYLEFREGTSPTLKGYFSSNKHDQMLLCAQRTRQLLSFAGEVDLPGAEETRKNIERFSEFLETSFLKLFNNEYRKPNWKGMASFASILHEFNGGSSVIREYVNQHEFFINTEKMSFDKQMEDDPLWNKLANPELSVEKECPMLDSMFDEMCQVIRTDSAVIRRVFPNPEPVMQTFLQRIFGQSIQLRFEQLFDHADSVSDLTCLRFLQLFVVAINKFISEVKNILRQRSFDVSETSPLVTMLQQNRDDLLVPYLTVDKFIRHERYSLKTLMSVLLFKFDTIHTRKEALDGSTIDRLFKQFHASKANGLSRAHSTERYHSLLKLAGFDRDPLNMETDTNGQITFSENNGSLELSKAEVILRWHSESLSRAVLFFSSDDLSSATISIVSFLLQTLDSNYTKRYFETLKKTLKRQEYSQKLSLDYLSNFREANHITTLLSAYITNVVLPMSHASLTCRREITSLLLKTLKSIEKDINVCLNLTVNATCQCIRTMLSPYYETPYMVQERFADRIDTYRIELPEMIVSYIHYIYSTVNMFLKDANYLLEFRRELCSAIMAMLDKFFLRPPVNQTGAIVLQRDLNAINMELKQWGVPHVISTMNKIMSLSSILIVDADLLSATIGELRAAMNSDFVMHDMIKLRSDYNKLKVYDLLPQIRNGKKPSAP